MDTTEQYIKMSFKAWGYAKGIKLREIPYVHVYKDETGVERTFLVDKWGNWYCGVGKGFTPLKSQDQLQEMVVASSKGELGNLLDLIYRFGGWVNRTNFLNYADSMEQLWLAFVQKENHNKVWIGEEWTKKTILTS